MEKRTFNSSDLSWISVSLKRKSDVTIYEGDLSDCGNEIGYTVGNSRTSKCYARTRSD